MLLRRLYFVQIKVETKDRGDESCFNRILLIDGSRMIKFQAVSAKAWENRTCENLIKNETLNAPADI
jgi:hypothetical protein